MVKRQIRMDKYLKVNTLEYTEVKCQTREGHFVMHLHASSISSRQRFFFSLFLRHVTGSHVRDGNTLNDYIV